MKSIFRTIAAAFIAAAALAACGAGINEAHAQVIDQNFKATNAITFNLNKVWKVEKLTGYVSVTFDNGRNSQNTTNPATPMQITDTGTTWAALLADPFFQQNFVQVGVSNTYYNVKNSPWVTCQGIYSQIGRDAVYNAAYYDSLADNCAFYNTVRGRSN